MTELSVSILSADLANACARRKYYFCVHSAVT